jgi:hypothetical protein
MRCELEQPRISSGATAFFKYQYYVKAFTMLSEVGKTCSGRYALFHSLSYRITFDASTEVMSITVTEDLNTF